jgi:anti-sigma B factor antagonist
MDEDSLPVSTVQSLIFPEIVTFPAEVDIANGAAVGAELLAAFRPAVAVVIADLRQTQFCDSTGIRQLVIASNHAVCTGCQLRVVIGAGAVRRALHVLGADQTVALYPDMQEALTGPSGPPVSPAHGAGDRDA